MKNEEDVARPTIEHLLRQGVAGVIVADNNSTDGTFAILEGLAQQHSRVFVGRDHEPAFYQGDKTSWLAELARRAGADWVLPFDADELCFAEGVSLGEFFRRTDASVVWAGLHEVLPTVESPRILMGSGLRVQIESQATELPKVIFRSRGWVWVGEGNHTIRGYKGERSPVLHTLHYQYRSREHLIEKARRGVAGLDAAIELSRGVGSHWRGHATLGEEEQDALWRALLAGTSEDHGGSRLRAPRVVVSDPTAWRTWDPLGLLR